jgi:hypothetical protein
MGNTIAGIGLRTRTVARCVTLLRRAICPCFGPWPFSSSRPNPGPKAANPRCPTLSATFTANLGASSADSPSAGMKSKSDRHSIRPGAALRGADPRTLPRPPPLTSKPGRHCLQGARAHRAKKSSASCPLHPLPRSGDFGRGREGEPRGGRFHMDARLLLCDDKAPVCDAFPERMAIISNVLLILGR